MRRYLAGLSAVTSLVIFLLLAVVCVRSFIRFDDLCWTSPKRCTNIVSVKGRLHLQFAWAARPRWSEGFQWDALPAGRVGYSSGPYLWKFLGVARGYRNSRANPNAGGEHVYVVPYWLPLLLTAPWPAIRARGVYRRRLARRRAQRGLCLACGYDLRASPERCPECGAEAVRLRVSVESA